MSDTDTGLPLDEISLSIHRAGTAGAQLTSVRSIYASVYAEPPYCETPEDVDDFVSSFPSRQAQPGFRLVVAWCRSQPIGLAFGHDLKVGTKWWTGSFSTVPEETAREYPGQTFAVIELAVLKPYRRTGVGRELHVHLLAGLSHERVTLLVRDEAGPAVAAYESWGYHRVGRVQPFDDAPTYNAMLQQLRGRIDATRGSGAAR